MTYSKTNQEKRDRSMFQFFLSSNLFRVFLCSLIIWGINGLGLRGQDQPKQPPSPVATCVEVEGALLKEGAKPGTWTTVKSGVAIPADTLLVALPKAKLLSQNKKIQLELLVDVRERGPFPILEAAVILHENNNTDLNFTLDRGVIGLSNLSEKGSEKVRIKLAGTAWTLTFLEPKTKVYMVIFGRHSGSGLFSLNFGKKAKIEEIPTIDVGLLVVNGKINLRTEKQALLLNAPPGPAQFFWSNFVGIRSIDRLEKLPEGVRPPNEEELKKLKIVCSCTNRFNDEPVDEVLQDFVQSDDELKRRIAVISMGALDQLPMLLDALYNEKYADVRDTAIVSLRHWMGRSPGQAQKLYDFMTETRGIPKIKTRILMNLLDGFDDEQIARPLTYELLILFLDSKDLAIREISWWHLQRLARVGSVKYDPAGDPAARAQAIEQIRKIIPRGKLPQRGNDNTEKK